MIRRAPATAYLSPRFALHLLGRLGGHSARHLAATALVTLAIGAGLGTAAIGIADGKASGSSAIARSSLGDNSMGVLARASEPSARGGERTLDVASPGSLPLTAVVSATRIPATYVVAPGDTLKSIAARFGLNDIQVIITANSLTTPDDLQIGQRLAIPANGDAVTFTAPTGQTDVQVAMRDPALAPQTAPVAEEATSPAAPDVQAPPVAESAPAPQIVATAPPAPSPTRAARSKEEQFIFNLIDGAQQSQRITGVPASVTIAQAILETSWGSSYLAREANNYFGIKALTKPGPAGVVSIDAWEVDANGRNYTVSQPFRKYNSVAESLIDHGMFFVENARYHRALLAGDDPDEFARRINQAGYATDPAYAAKLISYMNKYDLYQWDLAA
jgi:flagellum-specific peptidoglycan hydrolase FlgJ